MKFSSLCRTAAALGGLLAWHSGLATPPSTSAYYTDAQHSYVVDATSNSIGQVNMIACIMSAMRPDLMVNNGPYIALVDQNVCDASKRADTSNSAGNGAQATDYMTAVVNSTRVSNTDPMLVNMWIAQDQQGTPVTIYVHLNAVEAPTSSNPYGQFRLDFCGKPQGASSCLMHGFMNATNGALRYYETDDNSGGLMTTALKLTSVGTTSGSGGLDQSQTQNGSSTETIFDFAYDANYFLRGDQCFSRDAADPQTGLSVWSYGLYDATSGARINRNSGFPIQYVNGGVTYQGFIGYWGLSLPATAMGTLVNGATIQKVDYQNGNSPTTTSYTVALSGGKLTKYTKLTRTLHSLDQIHFTSWVGDATNLFAGATSNTQYELYWDESSGQFIAVGQVSCGNSGCTTQNLPSPQPVSPAFWSASGIQAFSQSLGGELFINLYGASLPLQSAAITAVYRQQDLVYPDQLPATLYCLNNCPTANSLTSYFATNSTALSPFRPSTYNNWNTTAASGVVAYTGDATVAALRDPGSNAVVLTDPNAYATRPMYQNGVQSGRMFANLSDAECTPGSQTYCDYQVNNAQVYYVWETGPNNWNQFAGAKDSNGAFLLFDSPLQVNFGVPAGAAYGTYAGTSLVLQYGGFGNLWGLPSSCVSSLTNLPASCNSADARYVPDFVIPYDVTSGVVTNGSTPYLVKWLQREIRFARKALSVCTNDALVAPSSVTLPTAADLLDPSDPASNIYVGLKPAVSGAPRVIQGEVKF